MPTYTVRLEVEVKAATPERAAVVARDALLDIDARARFDVHEMYYHEEADDWFPVEDSGWYAEFERSVRPKYFFQWSRLP